MDLYLAIKVFHILSSTVLFGTGLGIAFFMFRSHFTEDVKEKFFAARTTVLADMLFTVPAVIIQPLSGAWLVWQSGNDWLDPWLVWTYILYIIAGACWLPVLWIQWRLKTMAAASVANGAALPEQYDRLFKIWFALGWPAFISLAAIFFLMVFKPM